MPVKKFSPADITGKAQRVPAGVKSPMYLRVIFGKLSVFRV
jgi:hypothetical protein